MTAHPEHRQLMSLEQWCALGEDTSVRSELQEGVLIVSPKPRPAHQEAAFELGVQLRGQVPVGGRLTPDVDVVIDARTPATVRAPDLVVRRDASTELVTAADVLLAVEILSPGTRRTDLVTKRYEYAEAGIPHYWIVDLDDGPSLEALALENGAYRGSIVTGTFETTVPFGLRIDLAALVRGGATGRGPQ